ncbi:MAG: hypothetical protein EF811_06145 [Methanonatronarchaeia archaeon]|nr:MAG: hypothetical protein EF811_06145 [Methanonatronarchaeia archaeon]
MNCNCETTEKEPKKETHHNPHHKTTHQCTCGCTCGCTCSCTCGCGEHETHSWRKFVSKEEKRRYLEEYKQELEYELSAVKEKLQEL